ncbi:MAG: hypothetical protein HQK92_02405 [Nitrospirae bacterium]|nr:hypothetical protein [Nitrospirota bacterium]
MPSYPPLTPKLKINETNSVANFESPGKWSNRYKDALFALSESLDLEEGLGKNTELTGIPDMWARPRLFEMALFDAKHPLNAKTIGEWRGLLAMLALKEFLDIPLEAVELNLDNNPEQFDFIAAAKALKPTNQLFEDIDWTTVYIILFNKFPVGMTSPTTLVCTATNYFNRINRVKWYNGSILTDPVKEVRRERGQLSAWLTELSNKLSEKMSESGKKAPDEYHNIVALLKGERGFITELGQADKTCDYSNNVYGFKRVFFSFIDKPLSLGGDKESHIEIVTEKEVDTRLLLVEHDICSNWNIDERDLLVYNHIPFSQIRPEEIFPETHKLGSITLPTNVVVKTADSFFTKKLFLIEHPNAFPGTASVKGSTGLTFQGNDVTSVLPLSGELLDYYTSETLSRRISIYKNNDDDITVTFTVPLKGPEKESVKPYNKSATNGAKNIKTKSKDYTISKTYKKSDGDVQVLYAPPSIAIWPHFKVTGDNNWSLYFTYFSTREENTFYGEPLPKAGKSAKTTKRQNTSHTTTEITEMSMYPEAIACKFDNNGEKEYEDIGILLLETPPEVEIAANNSCEIGVDLGTTATNVYYRANDRSQPMPMTFTDNLFLRVTETPQSPEYLRGFINDVLIDLPFLSIYDVLDITAKDPLNPFKDGHIFYIYAFADFFEDAVKRKTIETDLKWGRLKENIYTAAFLKQIYLQSAAQVVSEGINQIKWKFSYPVNFRFYKAFKATWQDIIEYYNDKLNLKLTQSEMLSGETESVVAARYFARENTFRASFNTGAICIDIGGGTSDFSIWYENNLIHQTSVKFAGRNIFIDLFSANDFAILKSLEDNDIYEKYKGARDQKYYYAMLESLVIGRCNSKGGNGENWFKRLAARSDEPDFKKFKQLLAVGLAGLFYYNGLLMKYVKEGGLTKDRAEITKIYLGGRGVNAIHWLGDGIYNEKTEINDLFKHAAATAFSDMEEERERIVKSLEIKLSLKLKAEAAIGLVSEIDTKLSVGEHISEPQVLACEKCKGADEHNWNTILKEDDFIAGIKVDKELEQLKSFINAFNSHCGKYKIEQITGSDIMYNSIYTKVDQSVTNMRNGEKNTLILEPIFITELRELLYHMKTAWGR